MYLRGKIAPTLVHLVLGTELLNYCETTPEINSILIKYLGGKIAPLLYFYWEIKGAS